MKMKSKLQKTRWAGLSAIGGLVGTAMGAFGQQKTNEANMNMQNNAEAWMTQMSDTAMQRRVTDLKAAGLNPLLAVSQGGASTPGISPMQMGNVYGGVQSGIGQTVSSAQGMQMQKAQLQAQIDNVNADSNLKAAQAHQISGSVQGSTPQGAVGLAQGWSNINVQDRTVDQLVQQTANIAANTDVAGQTMKNLSQQLKNLQAQEPGLKADSAVSEANAYVQQRIKGYIVAAQKAALDEAASRGMNEADFNKSSTGTWFQGTLGLGSKDFVHSAISAIK